ncbi:hypothetical protein HanRHA438_Chr06g0284011 [Helianthus annuus]|nr:hypothetical protein HanRHA438_Chr06g0284011 [Helianthus annuus]
MSTAVSQIYMSYHGPLEFQTVVSLLFNSRLTTWNGVRLESESVGIVWPFFLLVKSRAKL